MFIASPNSGKSTCLLPVSDTLYQTWLWITISKKKKAVNITALGCTALILKTSAAEQALEDPATDLQPLFKFNAGVLYVLFSPSENHSGASHLKNWTSIHLQGMEGWYPAQVAGGTRPGCAYPGWDAQPSQCRHTATQYRQYKDTKPPKSLSLGKNWILKH